MDSFLYSLARRAVGESGDNNVGSATKQSSSSVSGLLTTLIPVGLTALAFLAAFLFLRRFERRMYAPRTYIRSIPDYKRSPALPSGFFNWIKPFWQMPDAFILQHHSLDAYFFVRFLKISCVIAFVGCVITWPILFPVTATGDFGNKQLDVLSFSNIGPDQKNRYYAHVFVSWIFFGFVLFMITRETIYYVNLRQAYMLSPVYSQRVSQRTVLYACVPDELLNEQRLREVLGDDVANFWINQDAKELEDLVKERDKVAYGLEAAETKLIMTAAKNHAKAVKKGRDGSVENTSTGQPGDDASGSIAQRYVPDKKRPTHRLKPIIGQKVDTINWSRDRLRELIPQVEAEQDKHHNLQGKKINAVFVEYKTQEAAQAAAQSVTHHLALHAAPRWIGIPPNEVIWSNLRIKWWERNIRQTLVLAFIIVLIIFWSFPVAFIGVVSNINYLTQKLHWLAWIDKIPSQILGIITSLLPTIMLAVLMALVPIIMRIVSKIAGAPSLAVVELKTQNYYFAFQAVQGFLVMTFASGAAAVVQGIIAQPSSATSLLAASLPKASNFFISYLILQGLTVSSGAILQIVGLVLMKVLGRLLDKTPRKMYNRWLNLGSLGWGSLYPAFELLTVIAIAYAIIAPLTLGFATIAFALLYVAFRYNFLYTGNTVIDTQGISYAQALQHCMVGLYIAEVCLIGLLAIAHSPGPLVLQILFLIFTVFIHITMNNAFKPLRQFLPKDLIVEERKLANIETSGTSNGVSNGASNGVSNGVSNGDGNNGYAAKQVNTGESSFENNGHTTGHEIPPSHKKPNFIVKFLKPHIYCDYKTMRRLTPKNFPDHVYSDEELRSAYMNPAVGSKTPLLWIPRDQLGISDQEVRHTSAAIPITNIDTWLDEKNKLKFNQEADPPIYEEPKEW